MNGQFESGFEKRRAENCGEAEKACEARSVHAKRSAPYGSRQSSSECMRLVLKPSGRG